MIGGVGASFFPLRAWYADHAAARHAPPDGNHRRRRPVAPQIEVPAHRSSGPYPSGLSRGYSLEGLRSLVRSRHTLSASLAAPARSDSPRTSRSRRCQGCLPPFPAAPGSGCPRLHRAAAITQRWSLAPNTNRQRLVAHLRIEPQIGVGARPPADAGGTARPARPTPDTAPRPCPSSSRRSHVPRASRPSGSKRH